MQSPSSPPKAVEMVRVRLLPLDPRYADDPEYGMADLPVDHPILKTIIDPEELSRRLRDITPNEPFDPEIEYARAVSLREELIQAGGRPLRCVHTFTTSQASPETIELYDLDTAMYELYGREAGFWSDELRWWDNFLSERRRRFRSDKRKGLIPPGEDLLPPSEVGQLQMLIDYTRYLQDRIDDWDNRQERLVSAGLPRGHKCELGEIETRLKETQGQIAELQSQTQQQVQFEGLGDDDKLDHNTLTPTWQQKSREDRQQEHRSPRRSSRLAEKAARAKKDSSQPTVASGGEKLLVEAGTTQRRSLRITAQNVHLPSLPSGISGAHPKGGRGRQSRKAAKRRSDKPRPVTRRKRTRRGG